MSNRTPLIATNKDVKVRINVDSLWRFFEYNADFSNVRQGLLVRIY